MQYQTMPFGWSMPPYLPLPPTIDDRDLFINSVVNGGAAIPGPEGPPGPAGVGIADAEVTPNPGELIIMLTDGTVINAGNVVGPQGEPGADGQPGPPGPPGPRAPESSCVSNATTIFKDYCAQETDCYIGVQLKEAATLTLPKTAVLGKQYTIKLEFGAPVGSRKLTVKPESPSLVNGVTSLTLTTPYESVSVIYNNANWWTI